MAVRLHFIVEGQTEETFVKPSRIMPENINWDKKHNIGIIQV